MPWHAGPWMMGNWMGGWWMMPLFGLVPLLLLVLMVAVVVAFARGLSRAGPTPSHRSPGLDALGERYAKGEIQRDEYLEKKRDLGG